MSRTPDHPADALLATIAALTSGPADADAEPTISAELSFATDAMRAGPTAANHDLVRGLLIPHTEEPVQIVEMSRDDNGSVLPAVQYILGGMVDAATCLSTLDFIVNDDGHYPADPTRNFNLRASLYRIGLWKAAVDGTYAVSDGDLSQARELLDVDRRHLALFGPVLVLGVDFNSGWASVPEVLIERLLTAAHSAVARQQALRHILAAVVLAAVVDTAR